MDHDDPGSFRQEEIARQIGTTEFTHFPEVEVYVMAALHPAFDDILADLTLLNGYGMSCCSEVSLHPDAARELAWTLLTAADILDRKDGQ